jgi:ribosomal protein S12 methylthiotransferase accessory factor
MDMEITFPGGLAVEAAFQGFTVRTDQPASNGGAGSAPSPFGIFLASIPTCAGFYALRFCQEREIDTTGMALHASFDRDPESGTLTRVSIDLKLPANFPEKYHKALLRTMDQCTVKRAILSPPTFDIRLK